MMGFCAGVGIVYPDRNPAPRNTYQIAMLKQAQSIPSLNFLQRFDTTMNVLHYGQKPIVSTAMDRVYNYDVPVGQNAIVAIMPFKYNQEDSLIFNRSSIDLGFARATQFKTIKDTLNQDEEYGKPMPKRRATYRVQPTGFPRKNQFIKKGECIIGKIRRSYEMKEKSD